MTVMRGQVLRELDEDTGERTFERLCMDLVLQVSLQCSRRVRNPASEEGRSVNR
jgi:hypothetical protein